MLITTLMGRIIIYPTNEKTKREKVKWLTQKFQAKWHSQDGTGATGYKSVLNWILPPLDSLCNAYWSSWSPLELLRGQSTCYSAIPSISEAVELLQHRIQWLVTHWHEKIIIITQIHWEWASWTPVLLYSVKNVIFTLILMNTVSIQRCKSIV